MKCKVQKDIFEHLFTLVLSLAGNDGRKISVTLVFSYAVLNFLRRLVVKLYIF